MAFALAGLVALVTLVDAQAESAASDSPLVRTSKPNVLSDSLAAPSSNVAPETKYRYEFGSGDRLRVRVFEREDLTAEYRVRTSGNIVMPVVGSVLAAGKDQSQLEKDISQALERATGVPATVLIDVVEWRPFYVAGYVAKPGAYSFIPGMTVLHAMAIAGGVFRPYGAEFGISSTRETGRLQSNLDDLKRQLARLARLGAERDRRRNFEAPPRLIELETAERIKTLMEDEQRILEQNLDTYDRQVAGLKETREFAQRELETQKVALEQLDLQIKDNQLILTDLQNLLDRQLTRRMRVMEVSNAISTLQNQRRAVVSAIERARKILVDTDRDLALLDLRRKSSLETQILEIQKQIDAEELALGSSKAVIEALTGADARGKAGDPSLTYLLLRESATGKKFVAADETTLMLPGDVLRVSANAVSSD